MSALKRCSGILGWLVGLAVIFTLVSFQSANGQTPDGEDKPTPIPLDSNAGMPGIPASLQPPALPANPSQADQGAQTYYFVCMVCHGNVGQGLTPEWVAVIDMGALSCWKSKCHGPAHPADGFALPKVVPAVKSPAIQASFQNAQSLHDFLQQKMPWQAPGSLKDEEYWQLTAFLLRMNGMDPGYRTLDVKTAAAFSLQSPPPPAAPPLDLRWVVGLGGIIVVILAAFLLIRIARKQKGSLV